MKTKPVKPSRMWAIVDECGNIYSWTIRLTKKDSIAVVTQSYEAKWKILQIRFRCVRVNVSAAIEAARKGM